MTFGSEMIALEIIPLHGEAVETRTGAVQNVWSQVSQLIMRDPGLADATPVMPIFRTLRGRVIRCTNKNMN